MNLKKRKPPIQKNEQGAEIHSQTAALMKGAQTVYYKLLEKKSRWFPQQKSEKPGKNRRAF